MEISFVKLLTGCYGQKLLPGRYSAIGVEANRQPLDFLAVDPLLSETGNWMLEAGILNKIE